ncbi:MAG: CoA transferase [Deltaproteobacteria bacterium]|nr:CoA transferase [Deltaproteobacteria bacterium]
MSFLDGVKILDFSRLLPGPYGTQLLADWGAEVLKVEAIGGGDYTRHVPPTIDGVGYMFAAINRGKQSLAIDLKHPRAKSVIERLLGAYGVVVETFRAGVMDRLGLGYEDLRRIRPDVIFVALSGYGASGPMTARAAHDINLLARSGVASLIGVPGQGPIVPGIQLADMSSGVFIACAVTAALYRRATTGEGSFVDLSMADCTLAMAASNLTEASARGRAPDYGEPFLAGSVLCYNYYRTSDGGHMSVGAIEPEFWRQVCEVLELPELLGEALSPASSENPHYNTVVARFATRTRAEWTERFARANACVEPVLNFDEMGDDPVFTSRGVISTDPQSGKAFVNSPLVNGCGAGAAAVPTLGDSTVSVLESAGYSANEIRDLVDAGVVAASGTS